MTMKDNKNEVDEIELVTPTISATNLSLEECVSSLVQRSNELENLMLQYVDVGSYLRGMESGSRAIH
jgi:hypothetical protein